MREPDISTLARRLAEQNNVDWRALSGSGPEGKVVERDVLDYLARVMAGEEATNPTPEPLPDGMAAWPDQDLNDLRANVGEVGTLGDLRQELGNAVRPNDVSDPGPAHGELPGGVESVPFGASGRGEPPAGARADLPGGHAEGFGDAVAVDEDIFLFDDADTGAGAGDRQALAAGPTPSPSATNAFASVSGGASDDLDDLLVAGDELEADDDFGVVTGDGPQADAAADTYVAGSPGFGELAAGSFDLTQDDPLAGDGADAGGDDLEAWTRAGTSGEQQGWGADIELGSGYRDDRDTAADDAGPDLWGEPDATGAGDALWATDAAASGASDQAFGSNEPDQDVWAAPAAGGEVIASAEGEATASAGGDAAASVGEESADFGAGSVSEGAVPEPPAVSPAAPDEYPGVMSEETTLEEPGGAEAGEAWPVPVALGSTEELPLARSAMILRRHIDLSALASSQLSVGKELGFDEPLGVAPFLLRAVAKAAGELDAATGRVALAVFEDGLRLRRVDDAVGGSFATLVEELAREGTEEDEPQLVAADLSGLDLDEALLDLQVPVVTLGRILYDNQRGAYRSTLAFTGAASPEAGARLLARVAELLDAPVRIVL